ncbi:MAG: DUF4169 family protein [Novosphingobium sp.]
MGDVINLRLARKAAARKAKEADAAGNRARHGRTKADRELIRADNERAARMLDGVKLDSRV